MSRLLSIAWKELRQLRRDRLTLAMMAALPVLQLLLFGYAINTDVRHMPTLVWDQDGTAESRAFAERLKATGTYDLAGAVHSYAEIESAFRRGTARVGLVIPPDHASNLAAGREKVSCSVLIPDSAGASRLSYHGRLASACDSLASGPSSSQLTPPPVR